MAEKGKKKLTSRKVQKIPATVGALTLLAVVLLLIFVMPYLGTVLFSALIAFTFNPVYKFLLRKTKRSSISLVGTLCTVFLAAILPITIILLVTITQVQSIVTKFSSGDVAVGTANVEQALDRGVDRVNSILDLLPGGDKVEVNKQQVEDAVRDLAVKLLDGLVDFIKHTGTAIFGLISTFILGIFLTIGMLKYQSELIDFIKKLSPFDDSINDLYLARAAAMTTAMVKGQFIIATIQGILSAFSLWLIGVEYFWFFATILTFLSFIPLGAGIITIPIGIVVALTGNFAQGLFVIFYHILVVSNVDNLLRPKLVPKAARMSSALLLLAVFSGLAVFGATGVVYGPVIMILLISALEIYAQYNQVVTDQSYWLPNNFLVAMSLFKRRKDGLMRGKVIVLATAVAIGVVNSLVFKAFEFAVNEGTVNLWNDVLKTDTHRWLVVPLTVAFGVGLSALIRLVGQERMVSAKTNPLEEGGSVQRVALKDIGVTALIGLASLVAGASLGPEASLIGIASGLGVWAAGRTGAKATELLMLASIGALLVVFVGSMLLVLLPLLMLFQKKKLSRDTAVPILLAGGSAYATLWLIDHNVEGFGTIPTVPKSRWSDWLLAVAVGFLAAIIGFLLKNLVTKFGLIAKRLNKSLPWAVSGALFGSIIGLLYLIGGQSVEFSGSEGTKSLHSDVSYGFWALLGILAVKLVVTAWSLASGYRGGLIFPSIYLGVATWLAVSSLFGSSGPGVLIGSIAGVFCAGTGSPAVALIFMAALLPLKLVGIAIAGIIGATWGNKLLTAHVPTSHK